MLFVHVSKGIPLGHDLVARSNMWWVYGNLPVPRVVYKAGLGSVSNLAQMANLYHQSGVAGGHGGLKLP